MGAGTERTSNEVNGVVELELERASQASLEQETHQSTWQTVVHYKRAVFWSAFMGLGAINWGLDVLLANGVISVPSFEEDFGYLYEGTYIISSGWQIAFNTASSIGGFFGAIGAGYMADWVGKKRTMWAACMVSVGAVFIQIFASTSGLLMAGKLINGLSLGAFLTIPSSYASEICPVAVRGLTTSGVQLFISIGQLAATLVLKGTGTLSSAAAYKIPFTLQFVFPLLISLGLYFCPESPWYLARQHLPDSKSKALTVLSRLGYPSPSTTLAEIEKTITSEKESAKQTSYIDCFRGSALRRTEIAMGITCVAQLTGVVFVIGYSSYFFTRAGLSASSSFSFSIGVSVLGLVGVLCSWLLINRVGRRTLALGGTGTLTFLLLVIGILAVIPSGGKAPVYGQVACIVCFAFIYLLTIGPVSYALFAEISSPRLRSRTVGLGIVVQNLFGVLMNIAVPLMISPDAADLKGKVGFIFAGTAAVSLGWIYFRVPETSDRTFEELDWLFGKGVRAREFKVCVVD